MTDGEYDLDECIFVIFAAYTAACISTVYNADPTHVYHYGLSMLLDPGTIDPFQVHVSVISLEASRK